VQLYRPLTNGRNRLIKPGYPTSAGSRKHRTRQNRTYTLFLIACCCSAAHWQLHDKARTDDTREQVPEVKGAALMRDRPCANKYTAPAAPQHQSPKHTSLSKQQPTHSLCQSLHLSVSPPTARKHSLVSVALFPCSTAACLSCFQTPQHTQFDLSPGCMLGCSQWRHPPPTSPLPAPSLLSMQKPNMRASLSVICLMACLMLSGKHCDDCQHLLQLSPQLLAV
jgi:hypothetical protein